jgi:hypothetical protein
MVQTERGRPTGKIMMRSQEGTWKEVPIAGGGQGQRFFPKFPFSAGGAPGAAGRPGQPGQAPLTIPYDVKKPKSPEVAGKVATAKTGLSNMKQIKEILFDKKGDVNWSQVMAMKPPAQFGPLAQGMPFTKGRESYALFLESIDAKIRAMTGAAINAEEIPFYESMFLPTIYDYQLGEEQGGKVAKRKIERLERFLGAILEEMEPGTTPKGEMGWDWMPMRTADGTMKNYKITPRDEWKPEKGKTIKYERGPDGRLRRVQ